MRYLIKELKKFKLMAMDDEIGKVEDFYFEDTNWMLRYLVASSASRNAERQLLLSPYVLREPDRELKTITVNLTRLQVENSPDAGTEKPVSRQHEHALHAYYGWPIYWGYPGIFPGFIPVPPRNLEIPEEELLYNPHLRSFGEIEGCQVRAENGVAGHVDDMVLDSETWEFIFLVVDTGRWFSGKKVLLSVEWVEGIEYLIREIRVNVSCNAIRDSPEYDPLHPLDQEFESRVYDHYTQMTRSR